MSPAPDPRLFIVASSCVAALLVLHAWRTYGARLGRGLIGALVVTAAWKELAIQPLPYEVLLHGAKPLGIPVGIIVGWLTTSLLAIEWARRIAPLAPRRLARRRGVRLALTAFFAGWMARAVEPIGQAAGWWRWFHHTPGAPPVLAEGDWAINVVIMCTVADLVAPAMRHLGWRATAIALAALAALLTLASTGLLALDAVVPPPVVTMVFVVVPLVWLLARGFDVAPTLADPQPRHRLRAWERCIPALAVLVIVATLAHYARATGHPELAVYQRPLAIAATLVFGVDVAVLVGRASLAVLVGARRLAAARVAAPRGALPARHAATPLSS